MSRRILDPAECRKLHKAGWSYRKIGEKFGVSRSAVHQCLRNIRAGEIRATSMEIGTSLAAENITALKTLNKSCEAVEKLMELLTQWMSGNPHALARIEEQDKSIRAPADLRLVLLKCSAELRQYAELQRALYESLSRFEQVTAFQNEVLDVIVNHVSPEDKARIIHELRQRRLIRQHTTITG